jgi:hypothetical protein
MVVLFIHRLILYDKFYKFYNIILNTRLIFYISAEFYLQEY